MGINTKETSCVVQNFKTDLHSLLSFAKEKKKQDPPGLVPLTDDCTEEYFPASIPKSFKEALEFCQVHHLQLATPDTPVKLQCLRDEIISSAKLYGPQEYWIAASNVDSPFFMWKTTQQLTNFRRQDWDIENGHPTGIDNRCVVINSSHRKLQEAICTSRKYFICEKSI